MCDQAIRDTNCLVMPMQPGSKEPQPMPEAAKDALNSKEEFNTSMPKRH